MTIKSVLVSALAIATATAITIAPASAGIFDTEPTEGGFYVAVFGGGAFPSDIDVEGFSDGAPFDTSADLDSSFAFGGAVGLRLGFRYLRVFQPRLELEVSRQSNDFSLPGGGTGEQGATFFFLNNNSDIVFSEDQLITPYIGGGLGFVSLDTDANLIGPAAPFTLSNEDTRFAGHIAVGLTYDFSDRLELYSEGRYIRVQNIDFDDQDLGGGVTAGGLQGDLDNFTLTGGLRLRF